MIIAIDGPSGSGKSSTAKQIAKALDFVYLDTGAMYRAVSVGTLRSGINPQDEKAVAEAVKNMSVRFKDGMVLLNGEDVTVAIREDAANKAVTPVSANPAVRTLLVEKQREFAADHDVVMEGRDIGTVVFPDADYKFFLIADLNIRAERRMKESTEKLSLEDIKADLLRRDKKDSSRSHSPLRKADDAIEIDTSNLTFDEQVDKILSMIDTKSQNMEENEWLKS
ncbi:MAG: (d)CMP kinase [Candidatus Marinimicrobia bacterium]|nr:(d)CMP kinase [Candidatus Neomarinimicrobiota bacterium]